VSSVRKIPFLLTVGCLCVLGWAVPAGAFGGFIENRGQFDSRVKYYCPGTGAAVYFTEDAVVVDMKQARNPQGHLRHDMSHEEMMAEVADSVVQRGCAVYIHFEGAKPSPVVDARGELETKYNYFLGNDPARWQTEVPAYSEVVYCDVWPGVGLVFREDDGGRLTYEAVLSPGTDAQMVQLRYEGADRVVEEPDGSILVETSVGSLREECVMAGGAGVLMLAQGDGAFLGDNCSPAREDNPSALLWSTFLGGSSWDYGQSLGLDASGNPVVVGYTWSADFPTTPGAYDTSFGGGSNDVVVAKLSASGSELLWSTYLGGISEEGAYSVALDASDNAVVTGCTGSSDFPTTPEAYDATLNGGVYNGDVFVAKLSASGSELLWSTFLGGSYDDYGLSLALDASGNAVVTGQTASFDFPTTPGAYDTSFHGNYYDVFVTKLSASGSALLWSTFVGDSSWDSGYSLVLDASGNAMVTGYTRSPDFPITPGAYDTSYNGGWQDAFVAKLSASGSAILWSTFLGGSYGEFGSSLALDALGNAVVTGLTRSSDFPTTPGAYDTSYNGGDDVFVAKLSASGNALLWSTFLGGSSYDQGNSLALDGSYNTVVTGYTRSSNFPTTPGTYDTSYNGGDDVFVAKLSASGNAFLWSTFLGDSSEDWGYSLALDGSGKAVVAGTTWSFDFPTTPGAYDTSLDGSGRDVFVAKIDLSDVSGVRPEDATPRSAKLYPSFPDPFRGSTIVQFHLPEQQRVSIALYDVQGRVVRTLVDGIAEPGMHQMRWEGKSGNDTEVAPGIYFIHMEAGSYRATKKVALLR
jgi:hypothetical protein